MSHPLVLVSHPVLQCIFDTKHVNIYVCPRLLDFKVVTKNTCIVSEILNKVKVKVQFPGVIPWSLPSQCIFDTKHVNMNFAVKRGPFGSSLGPFESSQCE